MAAFVNLLNNVIHLYTWAIIIAVLINILTFFSILNFSNHVVKTLAGFFNVVTDPLLRPIRYVLPAFNGVDLSPLIAILLLYFVRDLINSAAIRFF